MSNKVENLKVEVSAFGRGAVGDDNYEPPTYKVDISFTTPEYTNIYDLDLMAYMLEQMFEAKKVIKDPTTQRFIQVK